MSFSERLTRDLAVRLPRRGFLKALGAFVAGLGLAMVGNVQPAEAHDCPGGPPCCANNACCASPACTGCGGGGSICPPGGYSPQGTCHCCAGGWHYSCLKCVTYSGYTCYCRHDDGHCCVPGCPQGPSGNAAMEDESTAVPAMG